MNSAHNWRNNQQSHFFQTCGTCCCCIEKYHNFDRNEDYATVFLKWTDFRRIITKYVNCLLSVLSISRFLLTLQAEETERLKNCARVWKVYHKALPVRILSSTVTNSITTRSQRTTLTLKLCKETIWTKTIDKNKSKMSFSIILFLKAGKINEPWNKHMY